MNSCLTSAMPYNGALNLKFLDRDMIAKHLDRPFGFGENLKILFWQAITGKWIFGEIESGKRTASGVVLSIIPFVDEYVYEH
ncbi:17401_t:CDS:2 [Cetraspora pellucida]|uniref:17401_t:CDS:1 n=1 Tax=Cetraspora pellucida TaxID=1433469 RepID=A0A9N9NV94_9GLOM|nr:17401_t:CDS:2 [Cetraspora pellucida]